MASVRFRMPSPFGDRLRKASDGFPGFRDRVRKSSDDILIFGDSVRKSSDGFPGFGDRLRKSSDGIPGFPDSGYTFKKQILRDHQIPNQVGKEGQAVVFTLAFIKIENDKPCYASFPRKRESHLRQCNLRLEYLSNGIMYIWSW